MVYIPKKTGAIIDTELDWQAIGLFSQIKGDIDRAKERYEDTVEAGKKGGAKTIYDVEKAKQMVLEGATTDEIMEEIGCSERCARYYRTKFSSKNTENGNGNNGVGNIADENGNETATAITAISGNNGVGNIADENGNETATAITAISGNNLDKDIEKEIEKDKDTEKDKEKEIEREKEKERENEREREKETFFPPTFAHEIYSLYQELGLPLPKTGEIGFMQYDMKKGFENIKRQHLLLEDVIEAVKNYAKALSARDSWYHARLSFDRFTREDSTIQTTKKTHPCCLFGEKILTPKKALKSDTMGGKKITF